MFSRANVFSNHMIIKPSGRLIYEYNVTTYAGK